MANRRNRENQITFEIKSLENFNAKDEEKLRRFDENTTFNKDYIQIQTEKTNRSISERTEKIKALKKQLHDLKNGLLDDQINSEMKENSKKHIASTKKKDLPSTKVDDMIEEKRYSEIAKNLDRKYTRGSYVSYEREYEKYLEKCDSLPNYINSALEKMPNNSGYEWKGITFFGKKPKDNTGIKTIFEPLRNKVLRIHEYNNNIHSIYEKTGDNKRVLVSKHRYTKRSINI